MSISAGLVHLNFKGRRDRGNADLAIEPGEQVAGDVGGLGDGGFDNSGLGHFTLVTQEYTHTTAVNTR